eukprot:UN01559
MHRESQFSIRNTLCVSIQHFNIAETQYYVLVVSYLKI